MSFWCFYRKIYLISAWCGWIFERCKPMKDAICHVQPDINGGKSVVITYRLMAVYVINDIQANESQLFKYVLFFYRFMPLKRLLKTVKIEKINRPRGSKILVFQLENSIFCAKTSLLVAQMHHFAGQFTWSWPAKACWLHANSIEIASFKLWNSWVIDVGWR